MQGTLRSPAPTRRETAGAWLVVLGGLLVLASTLLPWYSVRVGYSAPRYGEYSALGLIVETLRGGLPPTNWVFLAPLLWLYAAWILWVGISTLRGRGSVARFLLLELVAVTFLGYLPVLNILVNFSLAYGVVSVSLSPTIGQAALLIGGGLTVVGCQVLVMQYRARGGTTAAAGAPSAAPAVGGSGAAIVGSGLLLLGGLLGLLSLLPPWLGYNNFRVIPTSAEYGILSMFLRVVRGPTAWSHLTGSAWAGIALGSLVLLYAVGALVTGLMASRGRGVARPVVALTLCGVVLLVGMPLMYVVLMERGSVFPFNPGLTPRFAQLIALFSGVATLWGCIALATVERARAAAAEAEAQHPGRKASEVAHMQHSHATAWRMAGASLMLLGGLLGLLSLALPWTVYSTFYPRPVREEYSALGALRDAATRSLDSWGSLSSLGLSGLVLAVVGLLLAVGAVLVGLWSLRRLPSGGLLALVGGCTVMVLLAIPSGVFMGLIAGMGYPFKTYAPGLAQVPATLGVLSTLLGCILLARARRAHAASAGPAAEG